MNIELKKLIITNRIARLKARGRDNGAIIKKLERAHKSLGN